jgi:hypothetical protein
VISGLEIRVIAYAIVALGLMGSTAWGAYTITSHHYERVMAMDKLAQDSALQSAQQRVIAAQAAQAAAEQKAEKDHEALVQADTTSRAAVLSSVRGLESALHLSGLSAAVDHSGQSGGSAAGAGGDPELERAVAGVNDAVEKAVAACQHDSTNYAGILQLVPR